MAEQAPPTRQRVERHTDRDVNEDIRRRTLRNIEFLSQRLDQIERRLDELDREWDMERLLEANAAALSLLGLTLSVTVSRKWLILPMVVAGFLLQHAVQGWCPPVELFRRLGVRTVGEIDQERYALKAIRGDFTGTEAPAAEPRPGPQTARARKAAQAAS